LLFAVFAPDACRPHTDEILVVDGHSRDRTRDIAVEHGARVTEIASHEYERRWGTSKVVVWMLWAVYLWSFVRNLI